MLIGFTDCHVIQNLLNRNFGGADAGVRCKPSTRPHVPPNPNAERYVMPVP